MVEDVRLHGYRVVQVMCELLALVDAQFRRKRQVDYLEQYIRRPSDQVIRHLVVRADEEKKVVERTRTKRQQNSERRRVKRGLPPQRQPGEGRSREAEDEDTVYSGLEIGPDEGV